MNSRIFSIVLALVLTTLAQAAVPTRPNIVFIMTDDHAAHAISAYGSVVNKTPNLDRIAKEGMRFDRCFVVNSICTPKLQTELGDLLISTCLKTESPKASVIETHSEHLILRILRRIRESADNELPEHLPAICSSDVAVNYFDRVGDAVIVTQLRINEEGEFIDAWPHGFFDERIGEMYG